MKTFLKDGFLWHVSFSAVLWIRGRIRIRSQWVPGSESGFAIRIRIQEGLVISKLQFLIKKRMIGVFSCIFFFFLSSKPWIRIRNLIRIHIKCWIPNQLIRIPNALSDTGENRPITEKESRTNVLKRLSEKSFELGSIFTEEMQKPFVHVHYSDLNYRP
jgi:hypothetical protein